MKKRRGYSLGEVAVVALILMLSAYLVSASFSMLQEVNVNTSAKAVVVKNVKEKENVEESTAESQPPSWFSQTLLYWILFD